VSGIDQYGNALPDQTALTTFAITGGAGGSFAGATYNPQFVGSWTVTGTSTTVPTVSDTSSITVTPGAPAAISISTQPAGTNSVDDPLTTQPVIHVQDAFGNANPAVTVTASLASGTGVLRNVTALTDVNGDATFATLGYSKSGEVFTITFTVNALTATSGNVGALTVGALSVSTPPQPATQTKQITTKTIVN
jgi:hypothetical protein